MDFVRSLNIRKICLLVCWFVWNAIKKKAKEEDNKAHCSATGMSLGLFIKFNDLYDFQKNLSNIDAIIQNLETNKSISIYVNNFWEKIPNNLKNNCPKTTKCLGKAECLSQSDIKKIKAELNNMKCEMAESQIKFSSLEASYIIYNQVCKIHEVWTAIKGAKNVIDDTGTQIKDINNKILELDNMAINLKHNIEKYENLNTSVTEQGKLIKHIQLNVTRIYSKHAETLNLISNIKIEVTGKIQLMYVYQQDQISNGFYNAIQLVINIIQCVQSSGLLSSGYVLLQVIITFIFFGLSATNGNLYYITGKTLAQLRIALKEIKDVESKLCIYIQNIYEAEDFLADNEK